jgi:hypothetical protein
MSRLPLAVRGHTFVHGNDGMVRVDGGKFVYEEALQIVSFLNSRNPLAQVNANVLIWERNGALRLIVLALLAIIAVVVFVLATR